MVRCFARTVWRTFWSSDKKGCRHKSLVLVVLTVGPVDRLIDRTVVVVHVHQRLVNLVPVHQLLHSLNATQRARARAVQNQDL